MQPVKTLLVLDKETISVTRISYAQLRLKTTSLDLVILIKIRIRGEEIGVRLVEEDGPG